MRPLGAADFWLWLWRALRKDVCMTTNAAPDLETRVQQWLSDSMTAWKRDNQWLLAHSDDAATLLKHQQAALTACRAEQARLQESCNQLSGMQFSDRIHEALRQRVEGWRSWAQFIYLGGGPPRGTDAELQARVCAEHDKQVAAAKAELAAQVATLTAALRRYGTHLDCRAGEFHQRMVFDKKTGVTEVIEQYPCTCGLDAALRAASEGAPP